MTMGVRVLESYMDIFGFIQVLLQGFCSVFIKITCNFKPRLGYLVSGYFSMKKNKKMCTKIIFSIYSYSTLDDSLVPAVIGNNRFGYNSWH